MPLKPRLEVISVDDFEEIHRATMKLLTGTGIVFRHEAVLSLFKDHGAIVEGNLVRLPEKLVEDSLKLAPQPGLYMFMVWMAVAGRALFRII